MKSFFQIIGSAALGMVILTSCERPAPLPEPENAMFQASLDATSQTPFKGVWEAGDMIEVACVKDGKLVKESLKAKSISTDGKSASFQSNGTLKDDAEAFYAILPGTGVSFSSAESWSLSGLENASVPSVTVAKAGKSGHLSFMNLFSAIAFTTDNKDASYAVLTANDGKNLGYAESVSFESFALGGDTEVKSLRKSVKAGETVYFAMQPGVKFAEGYKIEVFDAKDASLFTCTSKDALTIEKGKVLSAPAPDKTDVPDVPEEPKEPFKLVCSAILPDAQTPYKASWTEGDEIEVACIVDGNMVTEIIRPSDISADGKTCTLASDGTLPEADSYHAVIKGTGVAGYGSKSWSTADISDGQIEVPSVTVASTAKNAASFEFQNIFSLLSFEIDEASVTRVELKGNSDEALCKNLQVSFNSYNVNGSASPDFEAVKVMSIDVTPGKKFYIGLYPGLNFKTGYTLKAYNAAGKPVATASSTASFKIEKGKVYDAVDFIVTNPSDKTKGFDESRIVFSAAVVSDVHVNGSQYQTKWQNAMSQLKAKALEQDKDGLDAVLVAGDLIDTPSTTQLGQFKAGFEAEANPEELPLIYTVGNHDVPNYAWAATAASDSKYMRDFFGEKYFRTDLDNDMRQNFEARHCVVKGYHILGITPNGCQPIVYHQDAIDWLDRTLAQITDEEPDKYVILLTHPMISNTIYGSMLGETDGIWSSNLAHYWSTSALTSVLNKYPQVMVFGGHLHFPLNDPRSVWMGDFTVFGCGSVRYMAIENGGYQEMKSATVMKDCEQFSQGNLLQFDYSGNFRVLRMDFYNQAVIGEALRSDYPSADKTHLEKYNHDHLALANGAPELSSLETNSDAEGNVTAVWAAGTDDEFVHHYVLTLKQEGAADKSWKYLADFYLHPQTSQMKKEWSHSLGVLAEGSYTLELKAYDSWDRESNVLSKSFTVGSATEVIYKWKNDEAGSETYAGGDGTVQSDWLTYENGTVSWTANTGGIPREAELSLPNGCSFRIRQLSVSDFMGNWTLKSKRFNPNGTLSGVKGTDNTNATDLVFGKPVSTENLAHVANVGIKGLYLEAVMDACVEIDYDAKSVRIGIFLDRRSARDAGNGKYVAFLPECAKNDFSWVGYNFAPGAGSFSTTDYDWLWLTASDDLKVFKYVFRPNGQLTANGAYAICGISCVSATSADAAAIASAYDVIYQANYNTSDSEGLSFVRK